MCGTTMGYKNFNSRLKKRGHTVELKNMSSVKIPEFQHTLCSRKYELVLLLGELTFKIHLAATVA